MDDGIVVEGGLEYIQPVERVIPTADASRKTEPMGTIGPEDLKIFLTREILKGVVEWSNSDLHHELGGVFIGELCSHRGVNWLDIQGYIRARHYEHTAASFRFTHDSWSAISREREEKYEDKIVVGWHHTHPGYGIFLSGTDMFSHRNFFNLPWMFAMVVDPKAVTLGFFQWMKGMRDVKPCGFYYVS